VEINKGFYSFRDSKKDDLDDHQDQISDFLQSVRITKASENLFIIFGTWSWFQAVVMPKKRTLPLRGLEWSFMTGMPPSSGIEMSRPNKEIEDDADLIL